MGKKRITLTLEVELDEALAEGELDDDLINETINQMVEHSNALNEDDGLQVTSCGWDYVETNEPVKADRAATIVKGNRLFPGAVVKLNKNVERYPSAFVNAGEQGIISEVSAKELHVRLYSRFEGLAEWNNELHFYFEDPNHLDELEGLEVVA